MNTPQISCILSKIAAAPQNRRRRIIALAGPPASGKSTMAAELAKAIPGSCVVPMDGFHLDNRVLEGRGLLPRKGAPDTFDAGGFCHLIARLSTEEEVIYPTFDRTLDKSIAGAGVVGPDVHTVVAEGNYLLLDRPVWRDLAVHWDLSFALHVPAEELEKRLLQRWLDHGFDQESALRKARENDLPNAQLVSEHSRPADHVVKNH